MNDIAIHDRFFKSTLGRPDRLGPVLKALLPSELAASFDPASLVPLATESVGEGLDSSLMDLVFSARFGGQESRIHLIVEHKSAPDPWVHFQINHYLSGLWIRDRKEGRAPVPLLPIVFYHGVRPWVLPGRLSDVLTPPSELRAVNPDFVLPVIDLRRVEDEELRSRLDDVEAVLALLALKHIFEGMEVCARYLLKEIAERKAPYGILKPEIDYIGGVHGVHGPQEMKRVLDPIAREVGMAQSIVDTWIQEGVQQGIQQGVQQGIQQGLQQGIQQGIQQDQEQVIQRLLRRGGFSHEEIASLMNVEVARVQKIAESVAKGS